MRNEKENSIRYLNINATEALFTVKERENNLHVYQQNEKNQSAVHHLYQ